jgi:hypothetical protein
MTTIQEASEKIAAARAEMKTFAKTQGKAAIGAAFRSFFEKYPEVDHIQWTQYTPHFNDGDPCTFRVNDYDMLRDADGDEICGYGSDGREKEISEAFKEIWGSIDEDLLEACFGDGVEVTITADNVTVDDYDHD